MLDRELIAKVMPAQNLEERRWVRLRVFYWCVAILLGFLQAWARRHTMNPDGMSYLDMGDAYLRGDWNMAINAYWSPLYSWFQGAALLVARPSAYREFTVVHMVNFAIYLFALACFDFFLRTLIAYQRRSQSSDHLRATLSEEAWMALGFTLFMWSSLLLITLGEVNPDMCVAAFYYLAAGVLLRIRGGDARWSTFGFLGAILGIGYLARAPMFPLAFVFLGTSLFAIPGLRRAMPRFLVGLVVFGLVGGPYVFALSRTKGRFTFGDSGRLNYAEYVNGITRFVHWQGGDRGTGTPKHPTRKIFDSPPVYEFATPVGGTFPPWYDQSYWYEGVRPRFDLKEQLAVLHSSVTAYAAIFSDQAGLLTGFLALILLGGRGWSLLSDLAKQWHLLVPTLAALTMFGLVNVETRYVGTFVVLLWVGLFSAVSIANSPISKKLISCLAVAMAIALGIQCARGAARDLITVIHRPANVQWEVAEGLHRLGIRPGDKVASIGWGFGTYWARLARVSVVAEISYSDGQPRDSFWASTCDAKSQVIEKFAHTGAKVIVAKVPVQVCPSCWTKIGETGYYVFFLPR
jgi:hypothetical protein